MVRVRLSWLLALVAVVGGAVATAVDAAAPASPASGDWPEWRGTQRDGKSRETGLAHTWPEGGPPLLWKATGLGEGYTAPAVVGRQIYGMGNRDGKEWLWVRDPADGHELWATEIGPVRHDGAGYPGPRSTPTHDGRRLYALGLNGDLVAADPANGQIIWRHNLVEEFGGVVPTWGYSESVLVDQEWVLCTPGGPQATVLALEKKYGQTVWASPIGDVAGYASLVKARIEGVPQYVQFTSKGLLGVRAADGQLLWRYERPANGTANISTPVVDGPQVLAASGYGTGGGMVNVTKNGDEFVASEVYFTKDMKNHHGGMILDRGQLYGSNDPGLLTCLDFATGKVVWKDRSSGKCALVWVDGMLIARSEEGRVSLVEATPEEFRLLGRFEQPDRSSAPSWPHPVVAQGVLYLRDQDVLLAYDLKAAK